jgi:hypothetical protein
MAGYRAGVAIELIPLCTIDVTLADPVVVGEGASGLRLIYEVVEAIAEGERLRGKMLGPSADWVSVTGAVASVDVRATLETHDGAIVFAQYRGRTDISGGPIYVAPLFETGDSRYAWLNAIQGVGKGVLDGNRLRYEWFELR